MTQREADRLIAKVQDSGFFVDERIHIDMITDIINAMVEPIEPSKVPCPDCQSMMGTELDVAEDCETCGGTGWIIDKEDSDV